MPRARAPDRPCTCVVGRSTRTLWRTFRNKRAAPSRSSPIPPGGSSGCSGVGPTSSRLAALLVTMVVGATTDVQDVYTDTGAAGPVSLVLTLLFIAVLTPSVRNCCSAASW